MLGVGPTSKRARHAAFGEHPCRPGLASAGSTPTSVRTRSSRAPGRGPRPQRGGAGLPVTGCVDLRSCFAPLRFVANNPPVRARPAASPPSLPPLARPSHDGPRAPLFESPPPAGRRPTTFKRRRVRPTVRTPQTRSSRRSRGADRPHPSFGVTQPTGVVHAGGRRRPGGMNPRGPNSSESGVRFFRARGRSTGTASSVGPASTHHAGRPIAAPCHVTPARTSTAAGRRRRSADATKTRTPWPASSWGGSLGRSRRPGPAGR